MDVFIKKMKDKTRFNIFIMLIMIAIIVMLFTVGRSAFIAGGRMACHNTDSNFFLDGDFKCNEKKVPINFSERFDFNVTI